MKKYRNILFFGIFLFVLFLIPSKVDAVDANNESIKACYYQNTEGEQTAIVFIQADYTTAILVDQDDGADYGFGNSSAFYSVNAAKEDLQSNGCPRYIALNPGSFQYTPIWTEEEREEKRNNYVYFDSLYHSQDLPSCYYNFYGQRVTDGNAAFKIFINGYIIFNGDNNLVNIDNYSAQDIEIANRLNNEALAQLGLGLNMIGKFIFTLGNADAAANLSTQAYADAIDILSQQLGGQCFEQVYVVPDGNNLYKVYANRNRIPEGKIPTIDLIGESQVDIDGLNNELTCEKLFDTDEEGSVAWFLQRILDYIKILGPIAVVLLSAIDFIKAIFASDDDSVKKAQQKLTIRLACALALFLVPTLVELLLGLINGINDPNCGFH